jgi:hypothetical protein
VAPIVIYRGQKEWYDGMNITASSLRRSSGAPDPESWTEQLLGIIDNLLNSAAAGNVQARKQLEDQLLYAQLSAYQNPYVSCSRQWSVALGFALKDDTPGYVLTITGDDSAGLDFRDVRDRFRLFADSQDYLQEYGIPRQVGPRFKVDDVCLYGARAASRERVYP